jgi:hypothetical protein
LREQRVEEPNVARGLYLGQDNDVEKFTRLLDDFDHVVVRPPGFGGIDAHGAQLAAPFEIFQRRDHVGARAFLEGGRDCVLEVEKHQIGCARNRLFDHLRI